MLNWIKRLVVVAVVAALVVGGFTAFAGLGIAAAADRAADVARGGGGGRGLCGQAGLEAAAQALGLTADELRTQLRAGESLADLADEAGVEVEDVLDAMTAACQQAAREAIEQAVADGDLTQDHADWLLEGLDAGYWGPGADGAAFGPRGFGPRGFGGGHGPRFGGFPFWGQDAPADSTPRSDA